MDEEENGADISRVSKLRELSTAGMIDGQASYFNHLIDIYHRIGDVRSKLKLTPRERERVDLFLAAHGK
jgi:hypothetical protein